MSRPAGLLLAPIVLVFALLVVPMVWVCVTAFCQAENGALALLDRVVSVPLYATVMLNTLWISAIVTLCTLAVGFPIAVYVAHTSQRRRKLVLAVVASSFWLSILVRSYAWSVLLQRSGPVVWILAAVGMTSADTSLMYTRTAVVLGMVHILLPFMVLVLWTSMRAASERFRRVAYSLGATRTLYFLRVFMVSAKDGIAAGLLLVFLLSIGFYITPALLGGGKGETMMFSMLIEEQVNQLGDWPMGAALALTLLAVVIMCMSLAWCLPATRRLWRGVSG